jgi:hypothetical protein
MEDVNITGIFGQKTEVGRINANLKQGKKNIAQKRTFLVLDLVLK